MAVTPVRITVESKYETVTMYLFPATREVKGAPDHSTPTPGHVKLLAEPFGLR